MRLCILYVETLWGVPYSKIGTPNKWGSTYKIQNPIVKWADIGLTISEEEGRYALGSTRPCAHDHHRIVYELCGMEGRRAAAQRRPGRPTTVLQ